MGITVKDLIDRYSAVSEGIEIDYNVQLNGSASGLSEEESRVFSALTMGVVTEKVLKDRRESR